MPLETYRSTTASTEIFEMLKTVCVTELATSGVYGVYRPKTGVMAL